MKNKMKFRRAGISTNLTTILWALTGVAAVSVVGTGAYFIVHKGSTSHQIKSDTMAQELWGHSAPVYKSTVINGNGSVSVAPPQVNNLQILGLTGNASMGKTYTISGQLDYGTAPLPGQSVTISTSGGTLDPSTVTSDSNGNFSVQITMPYSSGTFTVTASSNGGSSQIQFTIAPATLTLNIGSVQYNGKSFTVSGNLSDSGSPLGGQAVSLNVVNSSGQTVSTVSTTTDASGDYSATIPGLGVVGDYTVHVSSDGSTQHAAITNKYAYRAVYYDTNYPQSWISTSESQSIQQTFGNAYYQVLNASALATFMQNQINNGTASQSEIVMSQDIVPDTVAQSDSTKALINQYIQAGGTVIWSGDVPIYYQGHAGKGITNWGSGGFDSIFGTSEYENWAYSSDNTGATTNTVFGTAVGGIPGQNGWTRGVTDANIPNYKPLTTQVDSESAGNVLETADYVFQPVSSDQNGYHGFVRLGTNSPDPNWLLGFADRVATDTAPASPTITENVPSTVVVNQDFTVTGTVHNGGGTPLANAPVGVLLMNSSGATTNSAVVNTDANGNYRVTFTGPSAGTYSIVVYSEGAAQNASFKTVTPSFQNVAVNITVPNQAHQNINTGNGVDAQFPFWVFSQLPTNMAFNQGVSNLGGGEIWTPASGIPNQSSGAYPNGTQFFHSSVNVPSAQNAYVTIPNSSSGWTDDQEVIFVNGKPVAQSNSAGQFQPYGSSVPTLTSSSQQVTVPLNPGTNDIVIEAMNNAGYGGSGAMNPAWADMALTSASTGQQLAWTGNAGAWQSTGYLFNTPSGWQAPDGSSEYVLQDGQNSPVYAEEPVALQVGQSGTVAGRLVDQNGNPLANQVVSLSTNGGSVAATAKTNSNGYFSAAYTAPNTTGTYKVTASADGASISAQVTVNGPQITNVTFQTGQFPPQVIISGYGFAPQSSQNSTMYIIDGTRGGWNANNFNSAVPINIQSISGDQIVGTLSGNYGSEDTSNYSDGDGSWVFAPNDSLTVQVAGVNGAISKGATYPSSATMPTVSVNTMSSMSPGATQTVSGTVTFNGSPVANQAVNLKTSGGSFTGGGRSTAWGSPYSYVVWTNSYGQFSATYQAPSGAGTYTIDVQADGTAAASTNVTVTNPITATLTEFSSDGSDGGSEYYVVVQVNGSNLTTNINISDLSRYASVWPGQDYTISGYNGSSSETVLLEMGNSAYWGDTIQVSVQGTNGVWYTTNASWSGTTSSCIYGCPEPPFGH